MKQKHFYLRKCLNLWKQKKKSFFKKESKLKYNEVRYAKKKNCQENLEFFPNKKQSDGALVYCFKVLTLECHSIPSSFEHLQTPFSGFPSAALLHSSRLTFTPSIIKLVWDDAGTIQSFLIKFS